MKLRFPIYSKILFWFFLNLVFIGAVFYLLFRFQFRLGLDSLLMGRAGDRIQTMSEMMTYELSTTPRAGWDDVLRRFAQFYQVKFFLFRNDGTQTAGEFVALPHEVSARINVRLGPPPRDPAKPPFQPRFRPELFGPPKPEFYPNPGGERIGEGSLPRRGLPLPGIHPKFMVHTAKPSLYWVLVRIPVNDFEPFRPMGLTLIALSDSIRGSGLFFDFVPWVGVGLGVLVVSLLFWFPLVRGITRSISQINRVTEQIAEGSFDSRVEARRTDELGSLSQSINRMAMRLSGFVTGQKRFLGDIAHELCSPIARMQIALGILEQRADEKQKSYVEDVREEVQHMSQLVNELLSFSKAGLKQKEIALKPVNVAEIVQRVVQREVPETSRIEIEIDSSLHALAEPELISRALANVLRNALRHAGESGAIQVFARSEADHVTIVVADQGPGVPEEMLEQIFDPFFRLDSSRSRDTGGIGLGLAIVRTCVEACQGKVTAQNRKPSGLQVEMALKAGPETLPT